MGHGVELQPISMWSIGVHTAPDSAAATFRATTVTFRPRSRRRRAGPRSPLPLWRRVQDSDLPGQHADEIEVELRRAPEVLSSSTSRRSRTTTTHRSRLAPHRRELELMQHRDDSEKLGAGDAQYVTSPERHALTPKCPCARGQRDN